MAGLGPWAKVLRRILARPRPLRGPNQGVREYYPNSGRWPGTRNLEIEAPVTNQRSMGFGSPRIRKPGQALANSPSPQRSQVVRRGGRARLPGPRNADGGRVVQPGGPQPVASNMQIASRPKREVTEEGIESAASAFKKRKKEARVEEDAMRAGQRIQRRADENWPDVMNNEYLTEADLRKSPELMELAGKIRKGLLDPQDGVEMMTEAGVPESVIDDFVQILTRWQQTENSGAVIGQSLSRPPIVARGGKTGRRPKKSSKGQYSRTLRNTRPGGARGAERPYKGPWPEDPRFRPPEMM